MLTSTKVIIWKWMQHMEFTVVDNSNSRRTTTKFQWLPVFIFGYRVSSPWRALTSACASTESGTAQQMPQKNNKCFTHHSFSKLFPKPKIFPNLPIYDSITIDWKPSQFWIRTFEKVKQICKQASPLNWTWLHSFTLHHEIWMSMQRVRSGGSVVKRESCLIDIS